jgi:outer membrane murein-binding lipoprotein Lpp
MKKIFVMCASFALFLSVGCASKDYVRQQVDPLVDRISKLEAEKTDDCCAKAEAAQSTARRAEEAANKCRQVCEKSFDLHQQK